MVKKVQTLYLADVRFIISRKKFPHAHSQINGRPTSPLHRLLVKSSIEIVKN